MVRSREPSVRPGGRPHRQNRVARGGAFAAAFAVLVTIGWQIIANTAADTRARTDPAGALAWRPDSAPALMASAEEKVRAANTDQDQLAAAADLAGRALTANPLREDAFRMLGIVADMRGDGGQAMALMTLAQSRSRRDLGADLWLFDSSAQSGNFASALAYADAVLRVAPDLSDQLFPPLMAIAADPDGTAAMVAMLAGDPPWRSWFFGGLPRDPAGTAIAGTLLAGLAQSPHPARIAEIAPYLGALIKAGDVQTAFLTWLRFLPADQAQSVAFAYNGDFEQPITNLPFDWLIGDVHGADTKVVASPDSGISKALRVVFSDTRVAYAHTTKVLVLPPGNYELSGGVKAEGLMTNRGMRWRIACLGGSNQRLGESDLFVGTFPWKTFAVSFSVPDSGCAAQTLRLELDTRVALDQQVVGTFWSDSLAIKRADAAVTTN